MQQTIHNSNPVYNCIYDITRQVEAIAAESKVKTGLVNVYVQEATTGIMILSFESRERIGFAELAGSVPRSLLRGKRTPLGFFLDRRLAPPS